LKVRNAKTSDLTTLAIPDSIRFPVPQWTEYYAEHIENWQVNYQELERIRDEMWKALEEHEKALQSQEEGKAIDEEDEEGLFAEDGDLEDDAFARLGENKVTFATGVYSPVT
jgi:hypothetical protein